MKESTEHSITHCKLDDCFRIVRKVAARVYNLKFYS